MEKISDVWLALERGDILYHNLKKEHVKLINGEVRGIESNSKFIIFNPYMFDLDQTPEPAIRVQ